MNYNLENVHPEIRAYIYQQLADLEQFLPEGAAISVLINDSDKKMIETTIKIETPFGEIQALEESADIYESLAQAKDNLVKQLGEIHRASGELDPEFDQAVSDVLNKRQLH